MKTVILSASALVLMTAVQAQRPAPGGTLERARRLFSQIDANGDGSLSAAEAGRTKIPTRDFVASDANRDRKLSGDEFLVFYRQLLVKGGKKVDDPLKAEVARIQAARRASKAQEGSGTGDKTTGKTDAERAADARAALTTKRIEAARDQKNAENADRAAAARGQKADENAARAAAVRAQLAKDAEAARIAAARAQKAAENGDRAAAVRAQLAKDAEAARIAAARAQKALDDAERAANVRKQQERIGKARDAQKHQAEYDEHMRRANLDKGGAGGQGSGGGQTAEQRAQIYIKRLLDAGRLTPQQAREFYDILAAKASSANDATLAKALRASLKRAKDRIGEAIRAGHLTAEEGRQLSKALDERARAALAAPEGDPDHQRVRSADGHGKPAHEEKGPAANRRKKHNPDGGKVPGTRGAGDEKGRIGTGRVSDPKKLGTRSVGGKKTRHGTDRKDG